MDIWLTSNFTLESIPDWNCPFCRKSFLQLLTGTFNSNMSAPGNYTFRGSLKCSACAQLVAFTGEGKMERVGHYPSLSDYFHEEDRIVYIPKYFHPAIPIIRLPATCPDEIKNKIQDSFAPFWVDLISCTKTIQTILELLWSAEQHKENIPAEKSTKPMQWSAVIEGLKLLHPNLVKDLSSLKWIGNPEKDIGKFKVLDAFRSVENIIHKLYGGG